ncbi:MAG: OPT/YSL family transporter, partial [Candidatus Thalassarchaeaceae archaeon]|nr:OPT/YSL family transporter [Candidatus Thalassarchaeaceae archaeon]
ALGLGFLLGAFAEWATGMGTSFGLGMYLPTPVTFPMLIGGAARDWWEKRRLLPKVEEIRLSEGSSASEKSRALMLLFTFMIAAGALTGEAFFGVESAILAVSDELETEQEYLPDSWTEDTYLDEILGVDDDDFGHVLGYATSRIASDIAGGNEPSCEILPDSVVCTETMSIKSWWPQARFAGFLLVNLALAAIIFVLFRAAGIIGVNSDSDDDSEVMDAEMAD